MQIKFTRDSEMSLDTLKIITHPQQEKEWRNIKKAILTYEQELIVIDAKTDNKVPIKVSDIIAIESEERMCNIKLKSGQMFLLNIRLKKFEETNKNINFIRINNGVMINFNQIKNFQSSENARIEVTMSDESVYFVNRYYIKKFKESLS